jgi:hypothetical protein
MLFYPNLEAKRLDSRPVASDVTVISALGISGPAPTTVGDFISTNQATGESETFEFSAVTSFNGRLIVADNETRSVLTRGETRPNALFFVRLAPVGDNVSIDVERPPDSWLPPIEAWDDIEGLASDRDYVYAIGSHSVSSQGLLRTNRQALLRLRPAAGASAPEMTSYTHLSEALLTLLTGKAMALPPSFAAPSEDAKVVRVVKDLNIEGLEVVHDKGRPDLLLGLRAPLVRSVATQGNEALVLRVHDVGRLFDNPKSAATVTEEARLDLHGKGISAIEFDSLSGGYLIASAPSSDSDSNDYSSLWLWKSQETDPSPNRLKELIRFPKHKLEGVGRIMWRNKPALMLAFDEERVDSYKGSRVSTQFGRLALLEHGSFKDDEGVR